MLDNCVFSSILRNQFIKLEFDRREGESRLISIKHGDFRGFNITSSDSDGDCILRLYIDNGSDKFYIDSYFINTGVKWTMSSIEEMVNEAIKVAEDKAINIYMSLK